VKPLTREQVEMELMQLLNGVGVGGNILAHDAALRAKVETLENHNDGYRSMLDTQATQLNDYVAQLAAMKQERDEAERREKQWEHDYATDLNAAHAERDRLKEAVLWALGYTDFRGRRADEGHFWWRKELQARALPDGISEVDIQAYQAKALRGETGGG
jgi:chromosome segregation ATPase